MARRACAAPSPWQDITCQRDRHRFGDHAAQHPTLGTFVWTPDRTTAYATGTPTPQPTDPGAC